MPCLQELVSVFDHGPLQGAELVYADRLDDAKDTGSSQNFARAPACSTWMWGGSVPSLP